MLQKINMPYRINWQNYKMFCYKTGLSEGDFNTLKLFIERK